MTDDEVPPTRLRLLRTDRLALRPATAADADVTFGYRRLDAVAEWLTELAPDLNQYRAGFTSQDRLTTTLVMEHGDVVIGDLMLRVEDPWAQAEVREAARGKQVELGWVLDPAHAGRGFATEAVLELLRYCFDELGVHRVVALCFADNVSSWRLMERVGMRREAHAVRESLHRSGEWMDSLAYAILADEYRSGGQSVSRSTNSARDASTPQ